MPFVTNRFFHGANALACAILAATLSPLAVGADLRIKTQPVAEVSVYPEHSVSAEVVAKNEARVSSQLGGVVQSWTVDVGQTVKKGALLATLDPADWLLARDQAQTQLRAAQAQFALAKRQAQRAQDLSEQGFSSSESLQQTQTQVTVAETQFNAAQIQLQQTQRQLDKTRVVAPFDAEVVDRRAQAGESVGVGTVLFHLVQLDGRELSAKVSSSQIDSLMKVSAAVWRHAGGEVSVKLQGARASQASDAKSRLHSLRVPLSDAAPVGPGASGNLIWRDSQPHLPAHLLVRREGTLGVFIANNGKAQFHAIPAAQEGQPVASDLPPQTPVVTAGQQGLQDGQPVNP